MPGTSELEKTAERAEILDARGLLCPLPVIRTQDRIKRLGAGAVLDVIASDPGALHDIPAWCRIHGHEVVETQRDDKQIRVRVRVHRPS